MLMTQAASLLDSSPMQSQPAIEPCAVIWHHNVYTVRQPSHSEVQQHKKFQHILGVIHTQLCSHVMQCVGTRAARIARYVQHVADPCEGIPVSRHKQLCGAVSVYMHLMSAAAM